MSNSARNGSMRVCLVCHTEPDVWNGGFASIDRILPLFLEMTESIRDVAGRSPRVAWCLTSQVVEHRPAPFRILQELGHEIGVHSHFPAGSGRLQHDQDLNQQHLDDFAQWFPTLCETIAKAGFGRPRTHAAWMFACRDNMTHILATSGIVADCNVCYGGIHHLPNGFLLADSRRRTSGKPYRLSERDHCIPGNSPVVELPVSGGFGCYWQVNAQGQFSFFRPVASAQEGDRQLDMFRSRLDDLAPGELDVFHVHFHLYDFLPTDHSGPSRLERARGILAAIARDPRAAFATPSEAVSDLRPPA